MSFSVGDRLGRFEILGSLGAGGMGEVYRARDPQLQRDVAIKVLPAEFSDDAARRRRFEQEARAAGGLNHPNILAVYDVGIEGTSLYIVTEVLEGETLSESMAGQALAPRRVGEYARQIASGLAAAHDHGVIHRDVKPGNLFVTTDGRIKILDFGLAKFVGSYASGETETVVVEGEPRTQVMGSVTYMSPEQARGRRLDHRTDIFSFGVVLYEMLAGFAPFRRSTSGETLNAILHEEPAPLAEGDSTVRALAHVVRHCLEKKPEERFQNAHDLIFDLDTALQDGAMGARRSLPASRATTAAIAVLGLLAATAIGAFAGSRWMTSVSESPPAPYRIRPVTNAVGLEEFSAISPDGRMVAFTAVEGSRRQIFVRYLNEGSVQQVTRDDADHEAPRWFADGKSLGYFSPAAPGEVQGTIYRIPTVGGPPEKLIASIGGGDIGDHGRIACFRLDQERIQLVTAALDGTDIRPLLELPTQHYGYPRWSPDRKWIAYQAGDGFRWDVHVVAADGRSKPDKITADGKVIKGLTWLSDSSGVIYASARASTLPYLPPLALWEARLDHQQRQLTTLETSYEQPDVHPGGLVSATRLRMQFNIWEYPIDRVTTGVERGRQVTQQTGQVSTPSASPDGGLVAYLSDHGGHTNVWVAPRNGPARQVTFEDDPNVSIGVPVWSPDGKWIAYLSTRGNTGLAFGVWLVRPDTSENHPLVPLGLSPAWSEDSKWIYYVERSNTSIRRISVSGGSAEIVRPELARNLIGVHASTVYYVVDRALVDGRQHFEIHAAPLDGGPPRPLKVLPASQVPAWQVMNPPLSPDGEWLAMPLTDGFTTNIWVMSTRDPAVMTRVTDFGDRAIFITRRLSWSSDGRSVMAAIGEGDADIVLLDGLIKPSVR